MLFKKPNWSTFSGTLLTGDDFTCCLNPWARSLRSRWGLQHKPRNLYQYWGFSSRWSGLDYLTEDIKPLNFKRHDIGRLLGKTCPKNYLLLLSDQNLWLNFKGGLQQWRRGLAIGPAWQSVRAIRTSTASCTASRGGACSQQRSGGGASMQMTRGWQTAKTRKVHETTPCPEKRCHFLFCHNFAKS